MLYWSPSGWNDSVCITYLQTQVGITNYFCIGNYPEQGIRRLRHLLRKRPFLAARPFLADVIQVDESVKSLALHINRARMALLPYEKKNRAVVPPEVAIRELHRLSTSLYILQQYFLEVQAVVSFLQESYLKYSEVFKTNKTLAENNSIERSEEAEVPSTDEQAQALQFLFRRCSTYSRWVESYKSRSNIQINLVINRIHPLDTCADCA